MPWSLEHAKWFVDSGERLETADGKKVEIWEFRHEYDEKVLTAWGRHFRNHYCLDSELDSLRGPRSRKEYLTDIKFPSAILKPGPSIRAGDFGEILVADYLEWILKLWVPRVRWGGKMIRNESPKGVDVIGFHFHNKATISANDILVMFEAKTKFSNTSKMNQLQEAINGSAKDHLRIAESLNFIKQKLSHKEKHLIERFQSPVDSPYLESFGAAAIISEEYFSTEIITEADCNKTKKSAKSQELSPHPNKDKLSLLIIKGSKMKSLANELYSRAADEA